MQFELFSKQLLEANERVEKLIDRREEIADPAPLLDETFAELQTQMAELQIVNETLLDQNRIAVEQAFEISGRSVLYREIFESVPVACFITDSAAAILDCNEKAGRLLNMKHSLLNRKPLANFLPLEDRRQFRTKLARLQEFHEEVQSWNLRIVPRGAGAEPIAMVAEVAPLRSAVGKTMAFRWILHPSSNEKFLEDRVRQLEQQLEAARTNRDVALNAELVAKRQIYVAEAATKESQLEAQHLKGLLEYAERQLDQQPAPEPMEASAVQLACQDLLYGIVGYAEMMIDEADSLSAKIVRSDASRILSAAKQLLQFPDAVPLIAEFQGEVTPTPANGNSTNGHSAAADVERLHEEIAEHRRSKDALVEHQVRTERKLQERTKQLQDIARELDGVAKYLSGNVAVRLQRLTKLGTNAAAAELQDIAQILDRTAEYAALSRAPLHVEKVNVSGLFREAVKNEELAAEGTRKLVVAVAESCDIDADRLLISTLCSNLVSNAFKFASGDDTLSIVVSCRTSKDHLTWTIQDNGIGFSADKLHLLFQPFRSLHLKHPAAGCGLGLATAKKIVERHGGKIWAESKPGNGSTFYFSLPRKA